MEIKNWKKLLVVIPLALLVVYFCAGIFFDSTLVVYIKPFIIPSFIIYAAINNLKNLTINYFLFVIFFYINEVLLLFYDDSPQLFRIALIASFFSYLAVLNLGFNSIKTKQLFTIPKGFTLLILALNIVFLIAILYILTSAIGDYYINIIIIFNAIATVFLATTAVLYLGKFTDEKSYYYFFGAFALIFSDVFAATGTYFIDNLVLNTLDRVLHFTSFCLIYLFMITNKKKVK